MKVLVWIGYGVTDVFDISTKEASEDIYDAVYAIVSGVYDQDAIEQLECVEHIGDLVQWVNDYTNEDENFDKFEIVEVL